MAILILKVFRTRHNGSFIPGKETPVTDAKGIRTRARCRLRAFNL